MDSSTIRVSRTIPASPTVIWKVISDIDSMGSRSPQCKKMIALPLGSNPLHPGGTTLNINRRGKYTFWATTARFLTVKPAGDGRTTVTLERLLADTQPTLFSSLVTRFFLGGDDAFAQEMAAGMQETLANVEKQAVA